MRAVAAARAIQAPAAINVADAQDAPVERPPSSFEIGNTLTSVLRNLLPALERDGRKTTSAVNLGLADREAMRQFHPRIVK